MQRSHLVLVLPLLLVGCGESQSTSDDPTPIEVGEDSGVSDSGRESDTADDATSDVADDSDSSAGPDLQDGELCEDDRECASGVCVRLDLSVEEGFCTSFCFDSETCPETWECTFFANSGGDAVRVCIPDDLCFDDDEDGYGLGAGCAGLDCDDSNPNVNPAAGEVCDGSDNDCDGFIDDSTIGAGTPCETGFSGVCGEGLLQCADGIEVCDSTRLPTDEICDGVDNDCDTVIDEGTDDTVIDQDCYGGPPETLGVGQCAGGTRTCDTGTFGNCLGQTLPFPEICDGFDNDCDGEVDEDAIGGTARCDTGLPGICALGFAGCGEGDDTCVAVGEPEPETCDGLDNDCDGEVDEDDDGFAMFRTCYEGDPALLGVGVCEEGTQTCSGGEFGPCLGDVSPGIEICDGRDNDCDGVDDEDAVGGGASCVTDLPGVCALGVAGCESGGGSGCVPIIDPSPEFCDGLDNDCDGEVDEAEGGLALTRECYSGDPATADEGACHGGLETCVGGLWSSCAGQTLPTFELCDLVDNDCDGPVDEGNPESGTRCSTGELGVCAEGVSTCSEGGLSCVPLAAAAPESCDGIDNDCDGDVDENADGERLRRTCFEGDVGLIGTGVCEEGEQICFGGSFGSCLGDVTPSPEVCDGADNDCDGESDEDAVGGGTCTTGVPGICSVGVVSCDTDGSTGCVALFEPVAELCDGLDNDCDGETDEGVGGEELTRGCYGGPDGSLDEGLCTEGLERCVAGTWSSCAGQVVPAFEICDGLDNNCNGTADELNPEGAQLCDTGAAGICAQGSTACTEGTLVCNAVFTEQAELCDGLDNDCDGETDEGVGGESLTRGCYGGPDGTVDEGLCAEGLERCVAGTWSSCADQVIPAFEICDGLDNDCDGVADELNPGGDQLCDTGAAGICAQGATACTDGALVCNAAFSPGPEACDGLDNDCDGRVDEDVDEDSEMTRTCYGGPDGTVGEGLCAEGLERCVAGTWTSCAGQVIPAFELCDTLDNDCDGLADESNPEGEQRCDTGAAGICAQGTTTCTEGTLVCNPLFTEQPEICDGFDNDCDGATDEDDLGDPLTRDCYDGPEGTEDVGSCAGGSATCRFGDYGGCSGQIIPVTEVCDFEDNDCDGLEDEGALHEFFVDADLDGFGDPDSLVLACFGPGYVTNGDDCYDDNSAANPEQEGYFRTDRGDGSFDYNCDDAETDFFGGFGSCQSEPPLCFLAEEGWLNDGSGVLPTCGEPGIYIFDCLGNGSNCDPTTDTTTQRCR